MKTSPCGCMVFESGAERIASVCLGHRVDALCALIVALCS